MKNSYQSIIFSYSRSRFDKLWSNKDWGLIFFSFNIIYIGIHSHLFWGINTLKKYFRWRKGFQYLSKNGSQHKNIKVTCYSWHILGPGPDIENDGSLDIGDHKVGTLAHDLLLYTAESEQIKSLKFGNY